MSDIFRSALKKVEEIDDVTKVFHFKPADITLEELNSLMLITLFDIETIAFSATHFVRHNTFEKMEKIQVYLNFILLDDSKCKLKESKCKEKTEDGEICMRCDKCVGKFKLQAQGPGLVNTRDIQKTDESNGIRVKDYDRPLFYLHENEDVDLILYAARGTSREHVRFRPVTTSYVIPNDINETRYHQFWIESVGILSPDDIFEKALTIYDEKNENTDA